MRKLTFTVLCLFAVGSLNAQNKNLKPLGQKELQEIQNSFVMDAQATAAQNVLTNDKDIKNHVLNKKWYRHHSRFPS